ncbi:hypothetical protein ACEWY4_022910 [Coilia grayii]|uniref:Ig-like domain-containing protein n=1 Tax=Coilia grayii TaxID=363190 RepID=A0ABD1J1V3_9TELE
MHIGVDVTLVAGTQKTSLVTCTARGPHPPPKLSWEMDSPGESFGTVEVTDSSGDQEGPVTTISQLIGVPSRDLDQKEVRCVVRHPTLEQDMVLSYTIHVHYPPQTVKIIPTHDGYECIADGNPKPAKYTWTRQGQALASVGVGVKGNRLYLSFTPELNGPYSCEATNPYGTASRTLTLYADNAGSGTAILLGTLITIAAVAAVAVTLTFLCQSTKRNGQQKTLKELTRKLLYRNSAFSSV